MITDPNVVRRLERIKVLEGRDPEWDLQSCEDYFVDWQVLGKSEFDAIKAAARRERGRRRRRSPVRAGR